MSLLSPSEALLAHLDDLYRQFALADSEVYADEASLRSDLSGLLLDRLAQLRDQQADHVAALRETGVV